MLVAAALGFTQAHGWSTLDTTLVLIGNVAVLGVVLVWNSGRQTRALHHRLTRLDELLRRVEDNWRFQHRQGTYVGSLEGLWKVLEIGLEQGGLDPALREKIYRAGDEMFAAFHAETASHEGERLVQPILWHADATRDEHLEADQPAWERLQ